MSKTPNRKKWDPKNSTFHQIVMNKYLKQGFTPRQAYNRGKKELEKSYKSNNFWT